jgi:hypothetical protein
VGSLVKRGKLADPKYYGQFKDLDGRLKMRALKALSGVSPTRSFAVRYWRSTSIPPSRRTRPGLRQARVFVQPIH